MLDILFGSGTVGEMSQGGTGEQEVQPGDTQNEAGAYAFSAFKSVVQTLAKRGWGW
jgi:hypothetical protein